MATTSEGAGPAITDEVVENYKARIGKVEPIKRQWHTEAARDNITHWAEATGDDNPLWTDPDYAATTKYGGIIAPPSFILSCNIGPAHRGATGARSGGGGLPGNIRQVWAGDSWEWFQPILLGDQIRGTSGIAEVIVKEGENGRSMTYVTEENFVNQKDELLSRHRTTSIAMERKPKPAADDGAKKERPKLEKWKYDEEQLALIEAEIDEEVRRGAETLHWDDVQEGEEIPHVVKGPLTITEIICFLQGWGGPFIMASEIMHKYFRLHPRANVPDFETGAPDTATRVHWDERLAQSSGFPTGYDIGGMRMSWMLHGLTNWCGDDGLVRFIEAKFTNLNLIGDTTYCKAKVAGKRKDGDKSLIDLDLWTVNQRGTTTTEGKAVVQLPNR